MKKVFLLIAFLFTMVCYAAPPFDKPASFLTEDVGIFRSQGNIAIQSIELTEIAFGYNSNESHEFLVVTVNQPIIDKGGYINRQLYWKVNKQNTNFRYRFSSNYLSSFFNNP